MPVTAMGLPVAASPRYAELRAPSGRWVALGLLLFAAIWLISLSLTSLSPPVDNIEQLTWVRSLQWGYYKHPPFPTWLIWLPVQILGQSDWTSYLTGGAVTMFAMGVFWNLLRNLRGARYATIALLATLCITYYNGRLNYYNHNIVLLLTVIVCAWCCWRAFEASQLRWWVALGVALGLGALSKYQIAVTGLSVLCFWLSQQGWREPVHLKGLLLAALTALLILSPHLWWLQGHDYSPIKYAMASSLGVQLDLVDRLLNSGLWVADQLLNRCLLALVLLGICAYDVSRRTRGRAPATLADSQAPKRGSRALILSWAVVPLVFMPTMGLLFGSELQLQWGTAFLPFVVPALMEFKPNEFWNRVRIANALFIFLALQGLLLLISYVTSPVGVNALKDQHWRTFSSKALADDVAGPSRAKLGGPIRVVIGDPAIAGALALQLSELPLVLIDGNYSFSPWVAGDLIDRCGALEVLRAAVKPDDATLIGTGFPQMYWRIIMPKNSEQHCSKHTA